MHAPSTADATTAESDDVTTSDDDEDWLESWKAEFVPLHIGAFVVRPFHANELLGQIARENALEPGDIAAAWFTTTPDLTSEFPAAAARRFGWDDVPLMCAHEMAVPASNPRSLPRCIRVLLLVNTDRPSSAMHFVYLRGAERLRVTA